MEVEDDDPQDVLGDFELSQLDMKVKDYGAHWLDQFQKVFNRRASWKII